MQSTPERTAVCMLADKEEIGSMGVTGMQSAAFDTFMQDLCEGMQTPLRVCYEQSFCLSADVTAAYDPNFDRVYFATYTPPQNTDWNLFAARGPRTR